MKYLVTWQIDSDAPNPDEAVAEALEVMRSPETEAAYFEVRDNTTTRVHFLEADLELGEIRTYRGNTGGFKNESNG